jgi:hypothetical protein
LHENGPVGESLPGRFACGPRTDRNSGFSGSLVFIGALAQLPEGSAC